MKNFKTILLSLFAIIASTEIVHPIIFTGPGRRQAHRQEEEDAYAAGVAAGSDQDLDDIEIQALGNGVFVGQDGAFLTKFKNATSEERKTLLASATPEQKALLQKVKDAQATNVKTQSMQSEDEDMSADKDAAVNQALEDAQLYDDFQAVQIQTVAAEPVAVLAMSAPAVQHVQAASSSVSPLIKSAQTPQPSQVTPAVAPPLAVVTPAAVAPEVHTTPIVAPTAPVVHVAATPTPPAAQPTPATSTPVAQPVQAMPTTHSTGPVNSTPATDTPKVVRVYPVYDAMRLAMHHIYSAAQDMINYAYSLVSSPAKPVKDTVEADKQNSSTEKSEVKVQSYRDSQPHADY